MYSLPIPLAGHCVVVLFNRRVVFLGGGEVALSSQCCTVQYSTNITAAEIMRILSTVQQDRVTAQQKIWEPSDMSSLHYFLH